LTNTTGLPISTGVSGLGTGIATFLATPTSANLASAVSDETGSGSLVFATSPTFVTPILGTPTSGTLTNTTGFPAANLAGTALPSAIVTSSLTALGTVATGVWNGTAIGFAYGGTGQTTASAGFNALSPITTTGDLILGNGTNSATRLPIGASTYVLTSSGTTASWQPATGGSGSSISNGTSNVTVNSSGGTVTVATAGTTALTVDTNQNVGIGTTSPATYGAFAVRKAVTTGSSTNCSASFSDAANSTLDIAHPSGNLVYLNAQSAALAFGAGSAERARIDTSGRLTVGSTPLTTGNLNLYTATNTQNIFYMQKNAQVEMTMGFKSSTDQNFYVGTGSSTLGTNGVYMTNGGVTWISVSDERYKENLVPITDAITKVNSLRSVTGNFIADTNKKRRLFLIAQDVLAVLPEAVDTSDAERYGLGYTDIIPLLVASIKELSAQVTSLTERIVVLENK
jgi:hypothetical protein